MTTEEKNARRRARYAEDPDRQKIASRRYRRANASEVRGKDRARKNTEGVRSARRARYAANPEPQKKASRAARMAVKLQNPEGTREKERLRKARQRKNIAYRLRDNLRARVTGALKRAPKHGTTFQLIGMSIVDFRERLQKLFLPGMTWENYGPVWHIDHIKPCAAFDLSDPLQQQECFHYSNLQPLFAEENLRKGANFNF